MTTTIFTTIETVQNLSNVLSVSFIESKNATFYTVTFFNKTQKVYAVKQ
jgi:nitrate reductase NapAB chaperone NapD